MLGLLVTAGGPAAAATPDAQALIRDWTAWQPVLAERARIPVQLDDDDLVVIAAGDVARHRERLQGTDRAVGAAWTDLPRDAVWIAILDDTCDTIAEGLTERHLPPEAPHQKLLFQHIAAPWPFQDRQWLIDIRNNDGLFAATGGAVWERHWALAADQERLRAAVPDPAFPTDDALWTPVNEGGWMLLDAAGGTLVVYNARADIGGAIPDDLATRWALSTLRGMLGHVLDRAAEIPGHYARAHPPIERPDGSVVPPWEH